jgi:ATP-dependent Zn protease
MKRWTRRTLRQKPGTTAHYNVLIIGATNRASTLDSALLRPGRFDRKIHVGNPGEEGRKDIIAYYLNKVVHEPVDMDRLTRATAGYSPARIKNVINEALIFARRDGRTALSYDDIWTAKLADEVGLVEPVEYSEKVKAATAIHEAGHAVASHFLRPYQPVQIVTVRKRGSTLGLVHSQDAEERHSRSKSEFLADIKVSLAGMVAEEIWLGESGSGPSSDLQNATRAAMTMVTQLGMGSQLMSLAVFNGPYGMADGIFDKELRREVDEILQQCRREIRALLEEQRVAMEGLRDALVERDELTGDEFRFLLWQVGATAEKPKILPQLRVQGSNGNGSNGNGANPWGQQAPPPDVEHPIAGSGTPLHGSIWWQEPSQVEPEKD